MTDKPTIVEALAAVMEEVRAVGKGDRNSSQNYNFRGIDAVVNAVGPVLRRHNVVVMPMLESANWRDVQTTNGKPSRECTVTVRYRFHGPAGDFIDAVVPGESMDFGDKGAPKAMSVAYRIALIQALCLPTTDTDPDQDHYERGAQSSTRPATNGAASNGHPAGNGHPVGADTPTAARVALAAACEALGLPLKEISAEYLTEHGVKLLEDENTVRIREFTTALRAKVTAARAAA
ncbi:MAG: hypothetical protein JWO67_4503 [Streptosporangiaceae bacterium]|nr:hypothetical protein [Streptosporangiaceae bacterium]